VYDVIHKARKICGKESSRIHVKFISTSQSHKKWHNATIIFFVPRLIYARHVVLGLVSGSPGRFREIGFNACPTASPLLSDVCLFFFFSPANVSASDVLWYYLYVVVKPRRSGMSLISGNRKPSNVKYTASCHCNPGRASVQLPLGVSMNRAILLISSRSRASLSITI